MSTASLVGEVSSHFRRFSLLVSRPFLQMPRILCRSGLEQQPPAGPTASGSICLAASSFPFC